MVALLFDEKTALVKDIELRKVTKKGVQFNVNLARSVAKYVDRFKKSRGTTKAQACQMLTLSGLKASNLIPQDLQPIGAVIARAGRGSFSENEEIITTVRMPVAARNAIIQYRIDNNLAVTIPELTQKFIIEGLESEGFLLRAKSV